MWQLIYLWLGLRPFLFFLNLLFNIEVTKASYFSLYIYVVLSIFLVQSGLFFLCTWPTFCFSQGPGRMWDSDSLWLWIQFQYTIPVLHLYLYIQSLQNGHSGFHSVPLCHRPSNFSQGQVEVEPTLQSQLIGIQLQINCETDYLKSLLVTFIIK